MNSPAWVPWLIVGMAVALAVVSALAGALWARARSLPLWQVAQLARELAERQRALEELVSRLERGSRAKMPARPAVKVRKEGIPAVAEGVSPPTPALPREGGEGRKVEGMDGVESTTPTTRRGDGAHPTPPGPTLIAVPNLTTAPSREALPAMSDELQRRHGAVWELADAGASAEQIATHLGLPIGHVHLILGLRKPLGTGPGNR
jgi:hypothetical protein